MYQVHYKLGKHKVIHVFDDLQAAISCMLHTMQMPIIDCSFTHCGIEIKHHRRQLKKEEIRSINRAIYDGLYY